MFQFTPWRFGIYLSALPMLAFLYTHFNDKNIILFVLTLISLIAVPGALKQNNPIFETSRCTFLNSRNIKGNNSDHNFGLITRDYLPAKTIGSSTMNKVPSFVEKQSMHPEMKGMSQNIKLKKATQKYGSISLYNQTSVEKGIYSIPVYYYPSLKYQRKQSITIRIENE